MSDATAFDYASMQQVALSLLQQFGQMLTVRRVSNTGGSQWEPTQTNQDYPTVGIITNLQRWYPAFTGNNDILRTDRAGLIAASPLDALSFVPLPNTDRLIDQAGKVWKIIDVKPVYPAGINVVYVLQLRV